MICPDRLRRKDSCSGNRFSDEHILRIVQEAESDSSSDGAVAALFVGKVREPAC